MEQKNRFSALLESLMDTAEIKNYTLAQELQYDVSYISKWISGKMLPSEKSVDKILESISLCVVRDATDKGREQLHKDYHVPNPEELKAAIYDNLVAEYNYVKELEKALGTNIAPLTTFYPELALPQFIEKMHHPVLRRVKSLEIMAAFDLLAMDHEYRLQIVSVQNDKLTDPHTYPDVHFSLMIHFDAEQWDTIYDTIFLINMLTNLTKVDFQLYGGMQAFGRLMFVVNHDFSISGMLISGDRCLAVTMNEEEAACEVLFKNVDALCNREKLLFRSTSMKDMVDEYSYVHTLLSPNLRWIIGHMTEHFMPDDLFEEVIEQVASRDEWHLDVDRIRDLHQLSKSIIEESNLKLLIYESAISKLAISSELDFFDHKVHLTPEQKIRYMEYLLDLCRNSTNLEIRMIYGRLVSDFQYNASPSIFLADAFSYLRLDSLADKNNVMIINNPDMKKVFCNFYNNIWNDESGIVIADRNAISSYIKHIKQGVSRIAHME